MSKLLKLIMKVPFFESYPIYFFLIIAAIFALFSCSFFFSR